MLPAPCPLTRLVDADQVDFNDPCIQIHLDCCLHCREAWLVLRDGPAFSVFSGGRRRPPRPLPGKRRPPRAPRQARRP
ncbi:MAG: hypothetical protein HY520_03860 [Candidatus Aenigmarchaeota archaeon]|nr:hypothetical protein [Candidatus Aenigmarchaeota archaeon]